MFAVSPVIELVNVPVAVPSVVWLPVATGFIEGLQQTPRAVTGAPPSFVMFPPLLALFCVIPDIAKVDIMDGSETVVVKLSSVP